MGYLDIELYQVTSDISAVIIKKQQYHGTYGTTNVNIMIFTISWYLQYHESDSIFSKIQFTYIVFKIPQNISNYGVLQKTHVAQNRDTDERKTQITDFTLFWCDAPIVKHEEWDCEQAFTGLMAAGRDQTLLSDQLFHCSSALDLGFSPGPVGYDFVLFCVRFRKVVVVSSCFSEKVL